MQGKDLMLIHMITGEVVEGATIMTPEDKVRIRQAIEAKKLKEINWISSGEENFIFHLFSDMKYFEDLMPQSIVRLIYLSTYIDYSSNILCFDNKKPMAKKDIKDIMILTSTICCEFFNELIEKGYMINEEDKYIITNKYFRKGKINKNLSAYKNNKYTRVYINAVRKLYTTSKTTDHIMLGYIFRLIPFVNLQWNIACHNPLEKDKNLIQAITIGEFCDHIGYDRKNAKRLIKTLGSVKFEWKNKLQRFCSFVYDSEITNMMIFVNPNIFYSGDHFGEVEILGIFF